MLDSADRTAKRTLIAQTLSGISWALSSQFLNQGVSFVITLVLARLFSPVEFGLVGMILVFTGFAAQTAKLGFGQALIQRQDIEERHLSSVFWLNILVGILVTGVFFLASPWISRLYGEPRLVPLTRAAALIFLISPFKIVQHALLQRELDFRRVALVNLASALISGIAAISMALLGFGVWSLIAQLLVNILCQVILLWATSKWKPRTIFEWQAIKELWSYSTNLTGYTVLDYWARNADNLLIGRYFGSALLGIYSRAYSLMLLPMNQLVTVVGNVMYPALARIQEDRRRVARAYMRALSVLALVSFPLMIGMIVVAEPFIAVLYGPKWAEVTPYLKILAVAGLVRSITITGKWLYQSQGDVRTMFLWELARTPLILMGFAAGILLGDLHLLAQIYVFVTCILAIPEIILPTRLVGLGLHHVARSLWKIALCSILMGVLVWLVDTILLSRASAFVRLSVAFPLGILSYLAFSLVAKVPALAEARSLVGDRLQLLSGSFGRQRA